MALPEKPFSTLMALRNSTVSLPLIVKADTHWKWERFAKQQFLKSYTKPCKVQWLGITSKSLSFACGTQLTTVLYIRNQIITLDFYTSTVNEDNNSFIKDIVNHFLNINHEKSYFDKEYFLIYMLYFFIYICVISILLEWCSRNRYRFILYNLGIVIIFLFLLHDETYDGQPYVHINIDRQKIRMPHLSRDFELPDINNIVNNKDEKSIIASISAKNNSDLYPLDIYFLSLNRVAPKTPVGRYSFRCDFDHCHSEDYWKAHFQLLQLKLQKTPNIEIIQVRPETAVQKVIYLQKSDSNHTDVISTSVLYLDYRVFEMSIIKPFQAPKDIDTVMRVAEEVEERLFWANKKNAGNGNGTDTNTVVFLAILSAFLMQFGFIFKKKKIPANQQRVPIKSG